MCSSSGLAHPLSRSEPIRFGISSFTPPYNPPQSVSFRARPTPLPLRSALNDTVTEAAAAVSFYELLGIPETGSLLEIKQAYKQLARKYHPDVSPPGQVEENTQRFIRVQEAYETLSDPSLRELYDRNMAAGLHLALNAGRRSRFDEEMEDRNEWKNRWQSQLSGLKRRSDQKETVADTTMSWGARMRREKNEMS